MFDQTFSDTETTISHESTQESETDIQLVAENQALLLREQNDNLLKENSSLRAQFEEALRITKQVEEMHIKNRKLKSTIRENEAKIESLTQRIEIGTRTIDELNSKLEDEKINAQSMREHDQNAMQKEIKKIKDQNLAQLDNLYQQLDTINKAKEKSEMDCKMLQGKIERCIGNAQHYFQTSFKSFDDFINYLTQVPMPPVQDPVPQIQQLQQIQQAQQIITQPSKVCQQLCQENPADTIQKLTKKLRCVRMKNKEYACVQEELENTINRLKRDIQDTQSKHKQEIIALKKAFEQKEEDMNLLDADQKHQIELLKNKVKTLAAENSKRKSLAHPSQIVAQPPIVVQSYVRKNLACNREVDLAIENMTQRNDELSRQIKSLSTQKDDLLAKLRALESQGHEQEILLEKNKNELNSLTMVHNETIIELNSLRKTLHEKEASKNKKEKSRYKREIAQLKSKVEALQSSLDSQKRQAYEVSLQNEQANHTIVQLNQKVTESKHALEENQRYIEDLKDDLIAARQAYENKQSVTPEDILPPTAWRYADFGKELSDRLLKVTLNPSLQPSSKLQNVFRTIQNYYNEIVTERNQALEASCCELQSIKYSLNQFLINLSISLGIEPMTLDYFFQCNGQSSFISGVSNLRNMCDDYKRSNEHLSKSLEHFNSALNLTPSNDFIEQANKVREQLCAQCALLQKRTKKYHDTRAALKTFKKKCNIIIEEQNQQISHLNELNSSLTKENSDLTDSNQKLKRELQNVRTEYRDYKDKHEETNITEKEKYSDDSQLWNSEKLKLQHQIQDLNKNLIDKSNEVSHSLAENEHLIDRLKKTIQAQKETITEKDNELLSLKQTHEDTVNEMSNKFEKEKKQIVKSYEKAVRDITEQCNTHRSDVEKLAKILAETEKKLKQSKSNVVQAKRDNMKLAADLQSQKEQNDRDKKLAESTTKTAILNAETNYNSRLEEMRSKYETDKRRLYAFVADNFKQFFNPHENIDDRSFKSIISRARDELSHHIQSDLAIRRLVGAASHQKTDDAVAQVLMNNS